MSMSFENILLMLIVLLAVIGLLAFVISKNRKDKKEFEAGGIEDKMEESKMDQQRHADKL